MLHQMEEHQIKRLPVIENHRLVGIISESDLAHTLDEHRLAEFAGGSTPRPDRPTPAVIPGGTRPACGAGN